MAHDALATVVYRDNRPVCIFGAGAEALDRMRRTAEAAGCRIASEVIIGPNLTMDCAPTASVLMEFDEGADEALIAPLLDWAEQEAASGARRVVISAPRSLIDLIWARAPHRDVLHLCGATDAERIVEVALASQRPVHSLHDVGRDEGPAILQQLTEDFSRIAAMLASLSEDEAAAIGTVKLPTRSEKGEARIDAAFVRSIIRARRLRDQYFRSDLFADPAWDMLLDLMAARLEENRVAVSSLCIAAAVPATTALRWIKALTDRGLFVRAADPQDGRRVYIELSDDTARALTAYLCAVQRIATVAI